MPEKEIRKVFSEYPDIVYGFTDTSYCSYKESWRSALVLAVPYGEQLSQDDYTEAKFERGIQTAKGRLETVTAEIEQILQMHHVKFIFCGSKKHLMADMFTNAKKPFYESSRTIYIDRIDSEKYKKFITYLFQKAGKNIDEDAVDFILEWTKRHTYYTQFVCNRVFAESSKNISLEDVKKTISSILRFEVPNSQTSLNAAT